MGYRTKQGRLCNNLPGLEDKSAADRADKPLCITAGIHEDPGVHFSHTRMSAPPTPGCLHHLHPDLEGFSKLFGAKEMLVLTKKEAVLTDSASVSDRSLFSIID